MIIFHGKENKVYGGREMEKKMDLSNFMYAGLDGYFKRNDNKQNFLIKSTDLTKECFIIFLIYHKKDSNNLVIRKMGNNLNLL